MARSLLVESVSSGSSSSPLCNAASRLLGVPLQLPASLLDVLRCFADFSPVFDIAPSRLDEHSSLYVKRMYSRQVGIFNIDDLRICISCSKVAIGASVRNSQIWSFLSQWKQKVPYPTGAAVTARIGTRARSATKLNGGRMLR